jgi:hypothetical protein
VKIMRKTLVAAYVLMFVASSGTANAGWKLIPSGTKQAIGPVVILPESDWNRSSSAPGKQGVAWTHDGFELNRFEVYAAVPSGQPLFKDRAKKQNPMPKFDKSMLRPDWADFFEKSFRVQYQVSDFVMDEVSPAKLADTNAIHIRYHYSLPNDDLLRKGEVFIAVRDGNLYVVNFQAPALHYFESGVAEFRSMARSLEIR